MSDVLMGQLLTALDIAVFTRVADGTFTAVAPAPSWFPRLAEGTFPFLGHILEEANEFWHSGTTGFREYGPCVETDDSGREFHYTVKALTLGGSFAQYLVFQLDPGSERLRAALQTAREQALGIEQDRTRRRQAAADVRRTAAEIKELAQQVLKMKATDVQKQVMKGIQDKCDVLIASHIELHE